MESNPKALSNDTTWSKIGIVVTKLFHFFEEIEKTPKGESIRKSSGKFSYLHVKNDFKIVIKAYATLGNNLEAYPLSPTGLLEVLYIKIPIKDSSFYFFIGLSFVVLGPILSKILNNFLTIEPILDFISGDNHLRVTSRTLDSIFQNLRKIL